MERQAEHATYIGQYPDGRFFGFCRCGYTGPSQRSIDDAQQDREAHLRSVGKSR